MIYQIQHKYNDGHNELISQEELNEMGDVDKMRKWFNDTAKRFPLPKEAVWLICNEKSPDMVVTASQDEPGLTNDVKPDANEGENEKEKV
jgi:hypothetical protein